MNDHKAGGVGRTVGKTNGAGKAADGGEESRGGVEGDLVEKVDGGGGAGAGAAGAGAAATKALAGEGTTRALPDVVGAGGFAEFLPLLDATIGR